jgi:CRISPR-associated protein Cas1
MGTLYVLEQGAMVHRHRERLVVRREAIELVEVPLVQLEQVVLFGGTHLTTAAANVLLERDLPVAMCALSGRLRGFLQPAYDHWVSTRCDQVRRSDDPGFRVGMAHEIVAAKIRNCRAFLRRLHRDGRADAQSAADALTRDLQACASAASEDGLRGVEGAAAARYFSVLRAAFGDLTLGRRGRGATAPGGALLNLAYGLLSVDVLRAVQLAGLDPFVGFYHRPNAGRPNLVLDLMEEWRPVLADSTALGSARRRVVTATDFESMPDGTVRLTNKALRRFLSEYHRRCETVATIDGKARSYREWIDNQARALALSLRPGGQPYRGFLAP